MGGGAPYIQSFRIYFRKDKEEKIALFLFKIHPIPPLRKEGNKILALLADTHPPFPFHYFFIISAMAIEDTGVMDEVHVIIPGSRNLTMLL